MTDEPVNLSLKVLSEIRDEVRGVREETHAVREEVHAVREEVHAVRRDLGARIDETNQRIVDSELRTATAITELAGSVHDLTTVLRAQSDLRPRVERCERDILDLRSKLP